MIVCRFTVLLPVLHALRTLKSAITANSTVREPIGTASKRYTNLCGKRTELISVSTFNSKRYRAPDLKKVRKTILRQKIRQTKSRKLSRISISSSAIRFP